MKATTITKKFMLILTLITTVITTAVVLLIGSGYSWFTDTRTTKVKINSSVLGSYFQSGTGTEEDPYEIHTPIQLYYFAWLQDLGAFNTTYEENGQTHIKQYHFYLSADLDMSSPNEYILPPVGTTKFPFVGNFNGQDKQGNYHKISNLTVSNIEALTDVPYTTDPNAQLNSYQIVGFFGIVGSVEGVTDNTVNEETGEVTALGSVTIGGQTYTYNSAQNEVKNFLLDTCTIESKIPTDNKTLVGIAAGYVAGYMSGVGVYNSSLDIAQELAILDGENMSEKLSGYALVGYSKRAMDEYAAANISGEGEGWGGSIDMKTMHSRLQSIMGEASTSIKYVSAETVIINEATNETTTTTTETSYLGTTDESGSTMTFKYYQSELGGSFVFADGSNSTQYDRMHGISAHYWPKTVTTYTYKDQYQNGYIFTDENGNYLKATVDGVSNVTDEDDATVFIYSNNTLNFYGDVPNVAPLQTYYLVIEDGELTTSSTSTTSWTLSNGAAIGTILNEQLYINFYNGEWLLRNINYATIKDGNYYLKATTTTISGDNDQSNASRWYINTGDNGGNIYTLIDNVEYYLTLNGTNLAITNNRANAAKWSWNSTQNALTTYYNGQVYGVSYSNGSWIISNATTYTIQSGTRYLYSTNGTTISSTTDPSAATKWTFSNGDEGGTISATINNNLRYLYNNNGTLELSTTNSTNWSIIDNNIVNNNYYLNYNTNWRLTEATSFYIRTYNGSYARITGQDTMTTTTDKDQATVFTLSNNRLTGKVGNTTYYLYDYNNNGTLRIRTGQNGTWSYDETNHRFTSTGNTTRYLSYSGSAWSLVTSTTTTYYRLYDSTSGVYLIHDGTALSYTTNGNDAYVWKRNNNNYFFATVNDTAYFLTGDNNNNYNPRMSTSTSYAFTINANRLRLRDANRTYRYMYYSDGSWLATVTQSSGHTFNQATQNVANEAVLLYRDYYYNGNSLTLNKVLTLHSVTRTNTSAGNAASFSSSKQRQVCVKTIQEDVAGGYDTYFPLSAANDGTYDVTSKNTGYIVSGSHASYQLYAGDIRVSSYYTIGDGRLSSSLYYNGYTTPSYDGSRLEVLTQTYKSNGLKRITDTYNSNNSNVSSSVSGYSRMTINELGLQKYAPSREYFESLFATDKSTIYGMHFMDSVISMNNMITAPVVSINNETYYNYELPEDSIDFRLKTKGFINFFAGSYYVSGNYSNNSFFALYEIERDNDNKITAIKHITKVYGNPDNDVDDYIYQFEGENTPSLPTGYVLMFDCQWIENPTMVTNALYYYEVPVNRGEYALGSVVGKYGAYLIYLDISANGGDIENQAFDYLTGVDFVPSNDSASLESMLTAIGNNNPTAIFNVSQTMVATEAQKVTFARSADTTVDGKVQSHFTITGSTTNQSTNVKYYYVPSNDKQKPEFIYLPSSG